MRLHCVSLGPRDRGRDHAVLPWFEDLRLPSGAKATLGDFALALFEWGLAPSASFAAFFPLDGARKLHLLARASYLGDDLLGPNVVTNGFIIDGPALAATHWRPHQLLPQVRPPEEGEWDVLGVDVEIGAVARPRTRDRDVARLGRSLRRPAQRIRLELTNGRAPDEVVAELIEAARPDDRHLIYWATSADLVRIARFDPAILQLLVHEAAPDSPLAPGVHRLGPSGLAGPKLHESDVERIWEALYEPETLPVGWAARFPAAAAACERANRPEERFNDDPREVAIDHMVATLAEPGIDFVQFWGLVERWAEAGSALDAPSEAIVHLAIGVVFRKLLESQQNADAKRMLLKGYIEHWPSLRAGAPMLPASLAATHGLIAELDDAEIELLMAHGLGEAFAEVTEGEIRSGRIAGARLAPVARGLRTVIIRDDAPPAKSLSLAAVVAERAADAADNAEAFAAIGGDAFALAERVLLCTAPREVRLGIVPVMVRFWRLAKQFDATDPVLCRVLAALRPGWRNSSRDERRRAFVIAARLGG